jgi:hypothetical protein
VRPVTWKLFDAPRNICTAVVNPLVVSSSSSYSDALGTEPQLTA